MDVEIIRPINCCFFLLKLVGDDETKELHKKLEQLNFLELETFAENDLTEYQYVAVTNEKNICKRGKIVKFTNDLCNIVLIDDGVLVRANKHDIKLLPVYFQNIEPRVFVAGMLAVMPNFRSNRSPSNSYWQCLYQLPALDKSIYRLIDDKNCSFIFEKCVRKSEVIFGNMYVKEAWKGNLRNFVNIPCNNYMLSKVRSVKDFLTGWNVVCTGEHSVDALYEFLRVEMRGKLKIDENVRKHVNSTNFNDAHQTQPSVNRNQKCSTTRTCRSNNSGSRNTSLIKTRPLYFVDTENYIEPITSLVNSCLNSNTVQRLKYAEHMFTTRQLYAVTYVSNRRDTILIDTKQKQITTACVFSLICMLRDKKQFTSPKKLRAIIICPHSSTCTSVNEVFKEIIRCGEDITWFVALNKGNDGNINQMHELIAGCYDVLITTALYCKKLIQTMKSAFIKEVTHIIFEDMSVLSTDFLQETKEIYSTIKIICHRYNTEPLHTVIMSNEWSSQLNDLINIFELNDPAYVITNPLEAVTYCNVQCKVHMVSEHEKCILLLEIIRNASKNKRIVIVCSRDEEVETINSYIDQWDSVIEPCLVTKHNVLTYEEDIIAYEKRLLDHEPIIMCSDAVLLNLDNFDFECLIHYSLPSSYVQFVSRFSLITASLITKNSARASEIHIMIQDSDSKPLPKISHIMERLHASVPIKLNERVQEILQTCEEKKKHAEICLNLIKFGNCFDSKCCSRHLICEADKPLDIIPRCGSVIKLKITHVYSANHYAGIITAVKIDDKWKNLVTNLASLMFKLRMHFSNLSKRRLINEPKIGDLAGFEMTKGNFHRVAIVDMKYDHHQLQNNFTICFIDTGGFKNDVPDHKLYVLPNDLEEIPCNCVEFVICNLLPMDRQLSWASEVNAFVKKQLKNMQDTQDDRFFEGKISLSLGGYVLLDRLHVVDKLTELNTSIVYTSVSRMLLMNGMAVKNNDHLKMILKCFNAAASVSDFFPGAFASQLESVVTDDSLQPELLKEETKRDSHNQ